MALKKKTVFSSTFIIFYFIMIKAITKNMIFFWIKRVTETKFFRGPSEKVEIKMHLLHKILLFF